MTAPEERPLAYAHPLFSLGEVPGTPLSLPVLVPLIVPLRTDPLPFCLSICLEPGLPLTLDPFRA